MILRPTIPVEAVQRCLLCHDAPCSHHCPQGVDPARLIRSLYFENEEGAALCLLSPSPCAACEAPCEQVCLRKSIPIRRIISALDADRQTMEPSGDAPVDLSCTFCGVKLENPFLLSSSVVASSYDKIARAFDRGWAGACFKTICNFIPAEASPRYSTLSSGSSFYGFKNIEQLSCNELEEDLDIIRRLKEKYTNKIIIASIMGRDEAEWTQLAHDVQAAGADIVECNFSCPNMEQGGLGVDVGQSEEAVAKYTRAARKGCTIPLLAKLTPNVTDMRPIAIAAVKSGADGIAAINTVKSLVGMNLHTYATSPSVRGFSGVGGYSGCAVKPIALRFIWEMAECKELAGVPLSAMGGVESWRDAAEFILLGANHVQITTAVMQYGYRIIDDLIEGLTLYLRDKALGSVSELQGLAVSNVLALEKLERDSVLLPAFDRQKCIGCGRCYLSCRDGGHDALTWQNGKPIMNPKRCVGCHLCVLVCPAGAIRHDGKRI